MASPSAGTTGPRRYMSKAQSACDFCRSRKSACQIESAPPCRLCAAHSKTCTFTGLKIRRKPHHGKRISAAGASSDTRGNNEDSIPTLPTLPSPTLPHAERNSVLLDSADWNDLFFFNAAPFGMPYEASDIADEQSQPSLLPFTDADGFDHVMGDYQSSFLENLLQEHPEQHNPAPERPLERTDVTAQLCGLTGDMDPYVLRRYRYNENAEFTFSKLSIRTVQDTVLPSQFLISPTELSGASRAEAELEKVDSQHENERDVLNTLIPYEVGNRLILLFFRFIYPQFPILSSRPDPENAPIHLLASIYSIALPFSTYDDRLCIDYAYNAPPSNELFNLAWKSLNRSIHAPTVATVQAGLLLLLRSPNNELVLDSAFKWTLVGSIVSVAQTIGLHLDPSQWRLPQEEVFLRKRLSWAVYAVDKWFALSLGRPSHINTNDWLVCELQESDVANDDRAELNDQSFICLDFSRLTTILDRVLTNLYSLKAATSLTIDYQAAMTISRELLRGLTDWYQNLDTSYQTGPSDERSSEPDATFSIHLCYHAVKITILRALLRPFYYAGATPPPDASERSKWLAAKEHCRLGAKSGASAAIKSISSLRASHYQAFWAPWCKTHFALATSLLCHLTVTSPPEEAAATLAALNQARQIYRVQSRSFANVRFALLRIDSLFWIGFNDLLNNNPDGLSDVH